MTRPTTETPTGRVSGEAAGRDRIKSVSPDEAAALFGDARRVVIVPGYGMALSHSHHTVRDLTHVLEARRIQVTFGVHPLAGRMPGQMNMLLGEADIPDDSVKQLEEVNPTFAGTDVVVVVGASDVVNPLAGMPDVSRSETRAMCWLSSAPRAAGSQRYQTRS